MRLMAPADLKAHILERIAFHEYICELSGHEVKESDLVMTLLLPHGKPGVSKLGVRPVKLGTQFQDGEPYNIYGFTLRQCRKLLKTLEDAEG